MTLGWGAVGEKGHAGRQGELVVHRNGVNASAELNKGPKGLNEGAEGRNVNRKGGM